MEKEVDQPEARDRHSRLVRADARRNVDALLRAAMNVFAESGVDAPMRRSRQRRASESGLCIGTFRGARTSSKLSFGARSIRGTSAQCGRNLSPAGSACVELLDRVCEGPTQRAASPALLN